jgi:hypothetical protein
MKTPNEYYIEPDFAVLAGTYDPLKPYDMKHLENAVNLLKKGNIEYRIVEVQGGFNIERKGMILTKTKK